MIGFVGMSGRMAKLSNNFYKKTTHQPVYPQRVIRHPSTPATVPVLVCMKYKSRSESDETSSSAVAACGPCNAISARSSLSRNSTDTSLPSFVNLS